MRPSSSSPCAKAPASASRMARTEMLACRLSRVPSTAEACSRMTPASGRKALGSNPDPPASPSRPAVSASISAWLNGPSSAIFPYLPVDEGVDLDALVAPHDAHLPQEFRFVPDLHGQVGLRQLVEHDHVAVLQLQEIADGKAG